MSTYEDSAFCYLDSLGMQRLQRLICAMNDTETKFRKELSDGKVRLKELENVKHTVPPDDYLPSEFRKSVLKWGKERLTNMEAQLQQQLDNCTLMEDYIFDQRFMTKEIAALLDKAARKKFVDGKRMGEEIKNMPEQLRDVLYIAHQALTDFAVDIPLHNAHREFAPQLQRMRNIVHAIKGAHADYLKQAADYDPSEVRQQLASSQGSEQFRNTRAEIQQLSQALEKWVERIPDAIELQEMMETAFVETHMQITR